jgi:hypothetical protein
MLDFLPIIGNVKSIGEGYYGHDPLAGRDLEDWERWVAVAGVHFGGIGKFVGKGVPKVADGLGDIAKGTDNPNHFIRTYRNGDIRKLEETYTADPRITVEMPYVGMGKSGTNAEDWLRDKDFYWKEIMNKHPDVALK